MKKDEAIKFIEEKGDTSYVIRTEDDDKKFLENYGKSVLEKELDPAISKIHTQYDDDLEKIFGKRKKPGEKTYNFMKSEFQAWKEKSDRVEQLETEIESLKKGSPEIDSKQREIKALLGQIDKMKLDHKTEIDGVLKNNLRSAVKSDFMSALNGMKLKPGLPQDMVNNYVDNIIKEFVDSADNKEGQLTYLKDGIPWRNPVTMLPFTAAEILKDRMKDVVDVGRKIQGMDMVEKVEKKDGKISIVLPSDVTSREKLGEHLVSLGVKRNTKEFMEAYAEYGKDLPAFDSKK